jgi:hypothetical protein
MRYNAYRTFCKISENSTLELIFQIRFASDSICVIDNPSKLIPVSVYNLGLSKAETRVDFAGELDSLRLLSVF